MVKIYVKNEEERKKFEKEYPEAKVYQLPKSLRDKESPLACRDDENPSDGNCLTGEKGIKKLIETEH